jgi:microcystin-dependent protein
MKKQLLIGLSAFAVGLLSSGPAQSQASNWYTGDIILVAFDYCPQGFVPAHGQLLTISSNPALYSLFGTQYGGNGFNTFAVPDFRGRVPISYGQGPGLYSFFLGQRGGLSQTTLTVGQMAQHSHSAHYSNATADSVDPYNRYWANNAGNMIYATTANAPFESAVLAQTGQGDPVDVRDPVLAMRYCVAVNGLYPPRN